MNNEITIIRSRYNKIIYKYYSLYIFTYKVCFVGDIIIISNGIIPFKKKYWYYYDIETQIKKNQQTK